MTWWAIGDCSTSSPEQLKGSMTACLSLRSGETLLLPRHPLLSPVPSHPPTPDALKMGGGQNLSPRGFTLRAATKDDLDDVTRIHIEGFTEEPQVHYCYPFRHQYPEDYWKWTRKEYENYLEQPQKYVVHVLEASSEVDGGIVAKPVGHAVWNVAVLTEAKEIGTL